MKGHEVGCSAGSGFGQKFVRGGFTIIISTEYDILVTHEI
jgi:hypothetical protein